MSVEKFNELEHGRPTIVPELEPGYLTRVVDSFDRSGVRRRDLTAARDAAYAEAVAQNRAQLAWKREDAGYDPTIKTDQDLLLRSPTTAVIGLNEALRNYEVAECFEATECLVYTDDETKLSLVIAADSTGHHIVDPLTGQDVGTINSTPTRITRRYTANGTGNVRFAVGHIEYPLAIGDLLFDSSQIAVTSLAQMLREDPDLKGLNLGFPHGNLDTYQASVFLDDQSIHEAVDFVKTARLHESDASLPDLFSRAAHDSEIHPNLYAADALYHDVTAKLFELTRSGQLDAPEPGKPIKLPITPGPDGLSRRITIAKTDHDRTHVVMEVVGDDEVPDAEAGFTLVQDIDRRTVFVPAEYALDSPIHSKETTDQLSAAKIALDMYFNSIDSNVLNKNGTNLSYDEMTSGLSSI